MSNPTQSRGRAAGATRQPRAVQDIHPEWLNVVRRLQSVARHGNRGLAVLTIKVLVNADGRPCRLWGDPVVTKWEPCNGAQQELDRIIANCTPEEQQIVLAALIDVLGRER